MAGENIMTEIIHLYSTVCMSFPHFVWWCGTMLRCSFYVNRYKYVASTG
jgi:hypothetical protein